ncbi:uncharacterized protein LOC142348076 [Convolutriloba macropyga]|uniref:uncharacterized protein LOC142348076 n=1 Tax=Convolutriloba macropyga TaxID=536237 RepID=UPI003F524523
MGRDHPSVAATLNNLAVLFGRRGRYRDAEPLCKRALEIREKALGPDHPDVAKQLNNLALLCQNQNKYDEVEAYYKRAQKIYEDRLGPDDTNVAKTKNNLAAAYMKQNKTMEAETLFKEVLRTAFKFPSYSNGEESHSSSNESTPHGDVGQWHKLTPIDSPTVSSTLKNLSQLYRRQGKQEAAEVLDEFSTRTKNNNSKLDEERRSILRKILDSSGNEVPPNTFRSAHMMNGGGSGSYSSGGGGGMIMHPGDRIGNAGEPGGYTYNSNGDGSMYRAGSLTKLRQSLQKSSTKLFKAFGRSTAATPNDSYGPGGMGHSSYQMATQGGGGMKRASSLSVLTTSNSSSSGGHNTATDRGGGGGDRESYQQSQFL